MEEKSIITGPKSGRRAGAKYLVLLLALATIFALPYAMKIHGWFTSGDSASNTGVIQHNEDAKKKILDWMAENSAMPEHILSNIYNAAALTGNRDLILAICFVESNFNPVVESERGAIGLMGIMPAVWMKELKRQGILKEKDDLYRVSENIAAGAHVFTIYLSKTNDIRKALTQYVGGSPLYAKKVMEVQEQIRLAQYADRSN